MKRNNIISLVLSFLLWWAICYVFNSTALIGKLVFAKAFISPWLTYTTVAKYMSLGMDMAEWLAYVLAALLLIFLLGSLYMLVYYILQAIELRKILK